MSGLAERGHQVRPLPVENDSPQPTGPLDGLDVVHIHRYCEDRAWRIAREAKAQGAAVVWDDDDNLATMPKGVAYQRSWGGFAGQRRRTEMRRLFQTVDLVTTPSRQLSEQLQRDGAPHVEVLPNFVADAFLNPDRRPHPGVTIGWTAGLEHAADVERMPILPALQRLLDERDDVNVISLGLRLGLTARATSTYGTSRCWPLRSRSSNGTSASRRCRTSSSTAHVRTSSSRSTRPPACPGSPRP